MTSSIAVIKEHIEIVEGAGGPKARIIGSRIRVQDIVIWHEKLGEPVDVILDQFPDLTAADVYAALAYYWDHRAEIEHEIAASKAYVERMRASAPRDPDAVTQGAQRGESHGSA